jgi:peroxiredoxin/Flp pilus assembly protein TadD
VISAAAAANPIRREGVNPMKRPIVRTLFLMSTLAVIALQGSNLRSAAQTQNQGPFRNPAMEDDDEFNHAITQGRVFARRGRPDLALDEFKKAAKLRDDQCAECYQLIGQTCFSMGSYKEAAEAYRRAVALKPENEAELLNALGVVLYLEKDKSVLEEAASALRRSIELSGGRIVKAYFNLGYALMKLGREDEAREVLKKYLTLDPSSSDATGVRAVLANPKMIDTRFAPEFTVESIKGETLSLEQLRGKIVLLDFWATWCGPCRAEMPAVKKLWRKYGGDQFVMVGVSLDHNLATLERYAEEEGITWPQYFDEDGKISSLYHVTGIPTTVLIDQDGAIRVIGARGGRLTGKIDELLKGLKKETAQQP